MIGATHAFRCRWASVVVVALATALGCTDAVDDVSLERGGQGSPQPAIDTTSTSADSAPSTTPVGDDVIEIALRIENRTVDPSTVGFAEIVVATLTDPRGWERAGYRFTFADDAPHLIVLAEGPEIDAMCEPYDTTAGSSCQIGRVVALRADPWREATDRWTGDLATYRQMLVNHEVGHLLGQHHPEPQCPGVGEPAPAMNQQSSRLEGCLPNPWPLDWEVACARLRLEPVAPGYEEDPEPRCTEDGVTR